MKRNRHTVVQVILVALATLDIFFIVAFTNQLTVRAIPKPIGDYTIGYSTHGGTVFVSHFEMAMIVNAYVFGVLLVICQELLNRARTKGHPVEKS